MNYQNVENTLIIALGIMVIAGLPVMLNTLRPWSLGAGGWREETMYAQTAPGHVRITMRRTTVTVTNVGPGLVSCGGGHAVGVAYPAYDLGPGNAMAFDTRTVRLIMCTAGHGLDVVYRAERGSEHQEYVRDL